MCHGSVFVLDPQHGRRKKRAGRSNPRVSSRRRWRFEGAFIPSSHPTSPPSDRRVKPRRVRACRGAHLGVRRPAPRTAASISLAARPLTRAGRVSSSGGKRSRVWDVPPRGARATGVARPLFCRAEWDGCYTRETRLRCKFHRAPLAPLYRFSPASRSTSAIATRTHTMYGCSPFSQCPYVIPTMVPSGRTCSPAYAQSQEF